MAKDRICGIYKIINLVNNMVYVGQSVSVEQRFGQHKSELRGNYHENDKLQKSWNKYKEISFLFELIEECNINQLDEKERYWISFYKSNTRQCGFNMDSGGNGKKKISNETKEKISKNHANVSGENNPFYGKKHPKETLNKIVNSEGYKNRKVTGEDNHRSKLTYEQVYEIKQKIKNGVSCSELMKEYGMSKSAIQHIKKNRAWKHVII